ncbi:MAG: hypothetical protein RML72_01935, partial [Bacteroidia bacterium]|nr:hypothetical protein [Bacteroidia bacterium]MDW8157621.1 hypothetical protein [Bacteroidia bacterium]
MKNRIYSNYKYNKIYNSANSTISLRFSNGPLIPLILGVFSFIIFFSTSTISLYSQCTGGTPWGGTSATTSWTGNLCQWAGEYMPVNNIVQCRQYRFTTCGSETGATPPYDTYMTLLHGGGGCTPVGGVITWNDDAPGCGTSSAIDWTASCNGTVRVLITSKVTTTTWSCWWDWWWWAWWCGTTTTTNNCATNTICTRVYVREQCATGTLSASATNVNCNTNVTLTYACPSGAATYDLQSAPTLGGPWTTVQTLNWQNTSSNYVFNIGPLNSSAFYRVVHNGGSCAGQVSNAVQITVNHPAAPTITSNATVLCQGGTLTLTANNPPNGPSGPYGPITYTWAGPASYNATGATVNRSPLQTNHTGVYTVTMTIPNCNTQTQTINITVNPTPTSAFNAINPVCVNSSTVNTISTVTFTGTPVVAGGTYAWNCDGCVGGNPPGNTGPHNLSWTTAGTKTVTLTLTNPGTVGNCTHTATVLITVHALPSASFSASSPVCTNTNATLQHSGS